MRPAAGMMAEGAFPNAETPAGKLRTPAPTILLTRLNMRADMVPSPPDVFSIPSSLGSSMLAAAEVM